MQIAKIPVSSNTSKKNTHLKTYIFQTFNFDIENLIKSYLIHRTRVFTHKMLIILFYYENVILINQKI